jgi:5-methylcytosine-specific restriction endonuclease McrA
MPELKVCNSCGSLHENIKAPVCQSCARPPSFGRGYRRRRQWTPEQLERQRIYGTAGWKKVRALALERDGYRCRACGSSEHLIVHHDVEVQKDAALALDVDNLETLCRTCHGRTHAHRRSQRGG